MNKYEDNSKALTWFVALALSGLVAGCDGGGGGLGAVGGATAVSSPTARAQARAQQARAAALHR